MNSDSAAFVFGPLSSPEYLASEARTNFSSVFHRGDIIPRDPLPGEPVRLELEVGTAAAVREVHVGFSLDKITSVAEVATVPAQRTATRWDELAGSYVDTWTATLPGQPEGTFVRYWIETALLDHLNGSKAPQPSSQATVFGYSVDYSSPPSWLKEGLIYQIFVDRFNALDGIFGRPLKSPQEIYGGTLAGITEKLPHLRELGATMLWLTPIFEAETYHGYDALDYSRVAERLGGDEALRDLVKRAHGHEIRVLLDFAANHCSWHNPFFVDAQKSPDSPYRSWFTFDHWPDDYRKFFTSPYLPELNTRNPEVVDYLSQVAARYLTDFEVDGFRLDYALGPPLVFWSEFQARLKQVSPMAFTVGEVTTNPAGLKRFEGRLDGCLDFPLLEAFQQFFVRQSWDAQVFHDFLAHNEDFYDGAFCLPSFLDNHDMNRFLWLVQNDKRRLKLAATCQFTLRPAPIIYYGTETGLSQEVDVSEAGFEAARLPMIWDDRRDEELFDFYRKLADVRRRHPCVRSGERRPIVTSGGLYVYECCLGQDRLIVALNNSDAPQVVSLPETHSKDILSETNFENEIPLDPFQSRLLVVS